MKQVVTPTHTRTSRPSLSGTSPTQLHSLPLLLARMGWMVLASLALGLIGISSLVVCGGGQPGHGSTTCTFLQPYSLSATTALVWILFGVLLFWRKSNEWLALLIALMFVFHGAILGAGANALEVHATPWQRPVLLIDWLRVVLIFLAFALFPDGRFVPRWTRWIVILCSFIALLVFLFPTLPEQIRSVLELLFFYGGLGCLMGGQVYRYRCVSGPVERQQIKWVLLSMSLLVFLGALLLPISFLAPPLSLHRPDSPLHGVFVFAMLLLPLSLVIAMLRFHLWGVDRLLSRTLVYGLLSACLLTLYALLVSGVGLLLQGSLTLFHPLLALLAVGLIALLFQPLRSVLQRAINRLLYGERDEPYAVLSRLGQQLATTLPAEAVLPTIVETMARTFKVPYVALTVKQQGAFSVIASYGVLQDEVLRLPLIHHAETVGELLLAPRAPGETFTAADDRLLHDLTPQVGAAVYAMHLTADLQRSRERLVTTREEERRRLRRDLHDGLGPMLASLTLKLDVARTLMKEQPAEAEALLLDLKAQTQQALVEIRRLVYALRPPTLDELGLVSALREHTSHYQHAGLQMSVQAREPLPALSAALEVALYRIAQEALTNVVRHAGASTCTIRIMYTDVVCLEVCDDGRGLPEVYQAGMGLTSMRERAAELGGTCEIHPGKAGGTRVCACLPLPKEHDDGANTSSHRR